ncbi:MAG: dephospho-CoA kinase, partial [Deltaproteobacteria bacterium]
MLSVALTGNIAAGKTTVARLFRQWGATVIDADRLAQEAQAPGGPVLAQIAERFGAGVLVPDGSLDRAALRRAVLADPEALRALNAIVH